MSTFAFTFSVVFPTCLLIWILLEDQLRALFSKPRVSELVKLDHDDDRKNFYHGKLEDGRVIQVRCRFGYVEILKSVSRKKKYVAKVVFSRYFDDRKHSCKMGFDDALYFLKKAGFNVKNTQLSYGHERRT